MNLNTFVVLTGACILLFGELFILAALLKNRHQANIREQVSIECESVANRMLLRTTEGTDVCAILPPGAIRP